MESNINNANSLSKSDMLLGNFVFYFFIPGVAVSVIIGMFWLTEKKFDEIIAKEEQKMLAIKAACEVNTLTIKEISPSVGHYGLSRVELSNGHKGMLDYPLMSDKVVVLDGYIERCSK